MKKLRPNEERAKGAIMATWVLLIVEVIALISGFMQYSLLRTVAAGGVISEADAAANDIREFVVAIIAVIALVIFFITFIMWFRRAYFNLHQKSKNLQFSEGWAAGSWFVPILNFYRPFQIMNELYTETERLLVKNRVCEKDVYPTSSWLEKDAYSTNYLMPWWILWIASKFVGNFVLRIGFNADTIDSLIAATIGYMIVNVLEIIFALLAIKVIKDYSRVEPLLAQISEEESSVDTEGGKDLQAHNQLSK